MSVITNMSRRLLRPTALHTKKWVRNHNFEGEYQATTVNMITQQEETVLFVNAFSPQGFRLNTGFRVFGPCVVFPKSVLHWNVKDAASIDIESLTLLTMMEPKLDIVVIGKGDADNKIDSKVIRYLMSNRINVEVLPTDQACGTFNFLNSERRYVAACLLPPKKLVSSFGSGSVSFIKDPLIPKTEAESEAYLDYLEDQEAERRGAGHFINKDIYKQRKNGGNEK